MKKIIFLPAAMLIFGAVACNSNNSESATEVNASPAPLEETETMATESLPDSVTENPGENPSQLPPSASAGLTEEKTKPRTEMAPAPKGMQTEEPKAEE